MYEFDLYNIYIYMGVEPKIGVVKLPNHPFLGGFPLFSPSILGYHYFWKHPYIYIYIEIGEGLCQYASMFSFV